MIYETVMQTPTNDNYEKHQFVERQFKPHGVEAPREYLWADTPGCEVVVRHHLRAGNNLSWSPLPIPEAGTKVRFQLRTHVRKMNHETPLINGLRKRVTELDYRKNLEWMAMKSSLIGWQLLDESLDMHPVIIPIRNPRNDFLLRASHFEGIAYIRSPERFAQALATGVGNGKGFGLGFIFFSTFGSSK